jgi:hypothetical protein
MRLDSLPQAYLAGQRVRVGDDQLLFLVCAAGLLLIALRSMRQALVPVDVILRALLSAAVAAAAVCGALVLLVAAALSGR